MYTWIQPTFLLNRNKTKFYSWIYEIGSCYYIIVHTSTQEHGFTGLKSCTFPAIRSWYDLG